MERTSKLRTRNILIIAMIILALVITGVIGFIIRSASTDPRSSANALTKPAKVYFEPISAQVSNDSIQTNVYFESAQGEEVSAATVVVKFPTDVLSFDGAATEESTTGANAECKSNGFGLKQVLKASADSNGNAIVTRVTLDATAPSGKFCFGTLNFKTLKPLTQNAEISFNQQSTQFSIVGSQGQQVINFTPQFGTGSGNDKVTVAANGTAQPTPSVTVTATNLPQNTPTISRTPTPTTISSVTRTPTPTVSVTRTPAPIVTTTRSAANTITPTVTTTSISGGNGGVTTVTPTVTDLNGDGLPDTAYGPFHPLVIAIIGLMFITSGLTVFTLRKENKI